uniref:Kinesin heavy chain n=1 Tax=Triatoma infestans TaxID=30076 RepID=A0A161MIS0_TRIIF
MLLQLHQQQRSLNKQVCQFQPALVLCSVHLATRKGRN